MRLFSAPGLPVTTTNTRTRTQANAAAITTARHVNTIMARDMPLGSNSSNGHNNVIENIHVMRQISKSCNTTPKSWRNVNKKPKTHNFEPSTTVLTTRHNQKRDEVKSRSLERYVKPPHTLAVAAAVSLRSKRDADDGDEDDEDEEEEEEEEIYAAARRTLTPSLSTQRRRLLSPSNNSSPTSSTHSLTDRNSHKHKQELQQQQQQHADNKPPIEKQLVVNLSDNHINIIEVDKTCRESPDTLVATRPINDKHYRDSVFSTDETFYCGNITLVEDTYSNYEPQNEAEKMFLQVVGILRDENELNVIMNTLHVGYALYNAREIIKSSASLKEIEILFLDCKPERRLGYDGRTEGSEILNFKSLNRTYIETDLLGFSCTTLCYTKQIKKISTEQSKVNLKISSHDRPDEMTK
uniref:Uncharacterized protein n=1 Tax=Glossina pallidipes TaxID=7398 RepID=A0A1A9ZXY1_GLOPL